MNHEVKIEQKLIAEQIKVLNSCKRDTMDWLTEVSNLRAICVAIEQGKAMPIAKSFGLID